MLKTKNPRCHITCGCHFVHNTPRCSLLSHALQPNRVLLTSCLSPLLDIYQGPWSWVDSPFPAALHHSSSSRRGSKAKPVIGQLLLCYCYCLVEKLNLLLCQHWLVISNRWFLFLTTHQLGNQYIIGLYIRYTTTSGCIWDNLRQKDKCTHIHINRHPDSVMKEKSQKLDCITCHTIHMRVSRAVFFSSLQLLI